MSAVILNNILITEGETNTVYDNDERSDESLKRPTEPPKTLNCTIPIIYEPITANNDNKRTSKAIRFDTTVYPMDSDEINENKRKIRDEIRR